MDIEGVLAIGSIFIGLPWLFLHYITKWKTAATLTPQDETLLNELHLLARRLDERMNTVERLVAADHPEFHPNRLPGATDSPISDRATDAELDELARVRSERNR